MVAHLAKIVDLLQSPPLRLAGKAVPLDTSDLLAALGTEIDRMILPRRMRLCDQNGTEYEIIVSGGRIKSPDYNDDEARSEFAAFLEKAVALFVRYELVDQAQIPTSAGGKLQDFLQSAPQQPVPMQDLCIDVAPRAVSGVCQLNGTEIEAFGDPDFTAQLLALMEREPLRPSGDRFVFLGANTSKQRTFVIAESDGQRIAMVLPLQDALRFSTAWYVGRSRSI